MCWIKMCIGSIAWTPTKKDWARNITKGWFRITRNTSTLSIYDQNVGAMAMRTFWLWTSKFRAVIKTTKSMWNRDIKSIRYWNENNSSTSYSEKVAKRLSFCSSPGRNVSNFCWNLAVKRQISSKCEKITLKKFPQQNESYWLAFRSQDRTNEGTHHRKLFKFV